MKLCKDCDYHQPLRRELMFIADQCVPLASMNWTYDFYMALVDEWWRNANEIGLLPETQGFTRAYCGC